MKPMIKLCSGLLVFTLFVSAAMAISPQKATAEPKSEQEKLIQAGAIVYNGRCKSCHGTNAELSALGTAKALKGQESENIIKKMNGYTSNSYGFKHKKIMHNIAKKLSGEQIKAVAAYTASLK